MKFVPENAARSSWVSAARRHGRSQRAQQPATPAAGHLGSRTLKSGFAAQESPLWQEADLWQRLQSGRDRVKSGPASAQLAIRRGPIGNILALSQGRYHSACKVRQLDTIPEPSSYIRRENIFPIWGRRRGARLRHNLRCPGRHRNRRRGRLRGVAAVLVTPSTKSATWPSRGRNTGKRVRTTCSSLCTSRPLRDQAMPSPIGPTGHHGRA